MPPSWNATSGDACSWPLRAPASVHVSRCTLLRFCSRTTVAIALPIGRGTDHAVYKSSKEEDLAALVDEAVRQYGCLDVMVNNAGRMQQNNHTPLDQIRIQDFDATFKLNVRGALLGIMHAARCPRH